MFIGKNLNPKENELYKRIDEILFYVWDPIGVSPDTYARDEYLFYLLQVFQMLMDDKQKDEIIEYLLTIIKDRMGLEQNRKH